jgi:hypothetical protein
MPEVPFMSEERNDLASQDGRNLWLGVAIGVLGGGVSSAVCGVIFLAGAALGPSADRVTFQLWFGGSMGVALACVTTGLIVATIRRRARAIWLIPLTLLVLPAVLLLASSRQPTPNPNDPPPLDLPLNEVPDGG